MAVFLSQTYLFGYKIAGLRNFLKKLFGLNGPFGGQKTSFNMVLGSILGFFRYHYSWLPWSTQYRS